MKFELVFSILKEHYVFLHLHSLSHFIAAHDSGWWIGLLVAKTARREIATRWKGLRVQTGRFWKEL